MPSSQTYRSRGCTPCAREVFLVNVDGSDSSSSFMDRIHAQNTQLCVVLIHLGSRVLLVLVNGFRMKPPSSVDVLRSDQLASQRLNDEGLPPIGRHPIPHVLQCPPNGGRRNAVVASEILVGHVRTVLQLHPLRRRVPTRTFGGLNCPSQGSSSTDSRCRKALLSKCHGNRRLGERGRTITTPLRGQPPQILPAPTMASRRQYGTTISALLPLRLKPDPSEAR